MVLPIIDDIQECSVYPGSYTLSGKTRKLLQECRVSDIAGEQSFPMSVEELENEYRLEIPLPGQRRENILIDVRPKVLDISVIHQLDQAQSQSSLLKEDERITAERHISLPPETDPVFASAKYDNGMLVIYLPKGEFTEAGPRKIVVY